MLLIGIAGGSGSGKTTFAKKIIERTSAFSGVGILNQDAYYLSPPPTSLQIHGEPNFDHPEAFDWNLLLNDIQKIKLGEKIQIPSYDYHLSRRKEEMSELGPCRIVILEGIYTLWNATLRDLLDIKVFLHVEADIRFIRRLYRDVRERGRNLDGIIRRYYDTVRPMHHKYLEPTQQFADVIVGEETDIAADLIASRICQVLA